MVGLQTLLVTLCASLATARPGKHHDREEVVKQIMARDFWATHAKWSISQCETTTSYQALKQRSIARRSQAMLDLRSRRGVDSKPRKFRRDLAILETFEAVSHKMTGIDPHDQWNPETPRRQHILHPDSGGH